MKHLELFLIFLLLFILSSCSYDVSNDQNNVKTENAQTKTQPSFPTTSQRIQSVVSAEIDGVYGSSKEDFFIKARIIKIEDSTAHSSFVIPGATYILIPSFQLDDKQKIMANNNNKSLLGLAKLRAGDTFKAEIFFEQFKGWYIKKVFE